jgi:trans-aconitate 2-methyltransferase
MSDRIARRGENWDSPEDAEMAAKDFGPIEDDYAFFMAHATEAESDAAEYARELEGFADGRATIRLLDFGCGTGDFTHRLVSTLNWPPQALRMALVEPVRRQREEAARRLTRFSRHTIESLESLPSASEPRFDLVVSNHALYYVDDLDATLGRMIDSLLPGGRLVLAIAGWDNALLQLWKVGFAALGRPVPYHAAEDVEAALSRRGAVPRKSRTFYRLRFPDTAENRLKVLRFLFGDHLREITPQRLLGEFDRYVRTGHVEMDTHSDHFAVGPA